MNLICHASSNSQVMARGSTKSVSTDESLGSGGWFRALPIRFMKGKKSAWTKESG